MAVGVRQFPKYVTTSGLPARSKLVSIILGLAIAAVSVGAQTVLRPVLGSDSFQLLLSAVAISVMYAGVRAGLAALLVGGLAKLFLFLPQEGMHFADSRLLARLALFLCLGLLICWLGQKLHASQQRVRVLSGLLPVCAWCKRVRDERERWEPLETYVHEHSEANFTHGLCPDCARNLEP